LKIKISTSGFCCQFSSSSDSGGLDWQWKNLKKGGEKMIIKIVVGGRTYYAANGVVFSRLEDAIAYLKDR
jgi:hypothetical protein